MKNLKTIADQVSQCPTQSMGRGRIKRKYTKELKKEICRAAQKYGLTNVANAINVESGNIFRWMSELAITRPKTKQLHNYRQTINFQEVPTLEEYSNFSIKKEFPLAKKKSLDRFTQPHSKNGLRKSLDQSLTHQKHIFPSTIPTIKLWAPSGICLELCNGNEHNVMAFVNAFIKGAL